MQALSVIAKDSVAEGLHLSRFRANPVKLLRLSGNETNSNLGRIKCQVMPCFRAPRTLFFDRNALRFVSSENWLVGAGSSLTPCNYYVEVPGPKNLTLAGFDGAKEDRAAKSLPLLFLNPKKEQYMTKEELCHGDAVGLDRETRLTDYSKFHFSKGTPPVHSPSQMLQSCIANKNLSRGKRVLFSLAKHGLISNLFLLNHLIHLYSVCGCLKEAEEVFNHIPQPDIHNWTVLASGFIKHGEGQRALDIYHEMLKTGLKPNEPAFVVALKACSTSNSLKQGRVIHADIISMGFDSSIFVANALLDMYVKCKSLEEAYQTFEKLSVRNLVSWNTIIGGFSQLGAGELALQLFRQMQLEGISPDRVTFLGIIKVCIHRMDKDEGKHMHHHIIDCGFELDLFVGTALIDMFGKFGSLDNAQGLFDRLPKKSAVSWTALIDGYIEHGSSKQALQLFNRMLESKQVEPNEVNFVSALKACGSMAAIEQGKLIHTHILRRGFEADVFVGSAIVDMYLKCKSVCDARKAFDLLPHKDVVTWNAMIVGYAKHGHGAEALETFRKMQQERVKPDRVTFLGILKACADLGALHVGKLIHNEIISTGLPLDISLGNSLLDMYAKCGSLDEACQVFNNLPIKNVVSWTALIGGHAQHGFGQRALDLFDEMRHEGIKPNDVTILGVLSACCHANLVNAGLFTFQSMYQTYGITPNLQHYVCLVDLLCRTGNLDKVQEFISRMPLNPDLRIWMSVLKACQKHTNVELGRHSLECILKLDPTNDAAYVLISQIYAAAGMWEEREEIRKKMKCAGIRRTPGQTWISRGARRPGRVGLHSLTSQPHGPILF